MSDQTFFLDYEGMHAAHSRLHSRASDLSGAAAQVAAASTCSPEVVSALIDDLRDAAAGRMYAYSDSLSMLAQLVDDAVTVFNQYDAELAAAGPGR